MTETTPTLELTTRAATGSTAARALRRQGKVPATLYGHGTSAVAVTVDDRSLNELLRTGGGHHLVNISLDGKPADTVLIRNVERDGLSRALVHADLQRVSSTESIQASVTIIIQGIAPGVKDQGGVLDMLVHKLDISGPAQSLPDALHVDVSALNVRDHVNAGQVSLPAGFKLITAADAIVVSIEPGRTTDASTPIAGEPAPPAA